MAVSLTNTISNGLTRLYPGAKVVFQTIVKDAGVDTDAAEITFKWAIGSSGEKTVTPVNTATGTYTAEITTPTDQSGLLRYRWDTDGALDYAEEGVLLVEPTSFDTTTSRDYM